METVYIFFAFFQDIKESITWVGQLGSNFMSSIQFFPKIWEDQKSGKEIPKENQQGLKSQIQLHKEQGGYNIYLWEPQA